MKIFNSFRFIYLLTRHTFVTAMFRQLISCMNIRFNIMIIAWFLLPLS